MSIVLPTFNGAQYLEASLRSCLDQTWPSVEVIVVIDGSTDSSRDVIARASDARVRVVDRHDNRGLPESLNEGFALARGEYLTWTSDDNVYEPHAIATMADHLSTHRSSDLVYAGYLEIDAESNVIGRYHPLPPGEIWNSNVVGACFLYRRSVLTSVGQYNPSARHFEDYEYWLRASGHHVLVGLDTILYRYRVHASSLTGRMNVLDRERAIILMKRKLGGISRFTMWQQMAQVDVASAFTSFGQGDWRDSFEYAVVGMLRRPSFAANRGVWSIAARSLVHIVENHLFWRSV